MTDVEKKLFYGLGTAGTLGANILALNALSKALSKSPDFPLWKARLIQAIESDVLKKPRVLLKAIESPVSSYYNPFHSPGPLIAYRKLPTFFHELGHHLTTPRALPVQIPLTLLRKLKLPIALGLGVTFAEHPLAGAAATGLISLPTLFEEALAHAKGYEIARRWSKAPLGKFIIPKRMASPRIFASVAFPALLTYLTASLFPYFAAGGFETLRSKE